MDSQLKTCMDKAVEDFRKAIQESGLGHFVQNEEVSWGDAQNEFRGFEIVR